MRNDPYHYKSKFVVTVLAIFVLLIAYGYFSTNNIAGIGQQNSVQDSNNDEFNKAVLSSDATSCDELQQPQKNNCILLIVAAKAVNDDNPELCNDHLEIAQQCLDKYETNKALASGDCAKVQSKDSCYLELAFYSLDVSYCDKIQDAVVKNNCKGAIS